MLDIRDMSEKDKLFFFLECLKPWARAELQRQRVQDLARAQAASECLTFYIEPKRASQHKNGGGSKPKGGHGKPKSGEPTVRLRPKTMSIVDKDSHEGKMVTRASPLLSQMVVGAAPSNVIYAANRIG